MKAKQIFCFGKIRKRKPENITTRNTILPSTWKPSCALVKLLFNVQIASILRPKEVKRYKFVTKGELLPYWGMLTHNCEHSDAERGQKILCNHGGVAPILRNVNSKLQTFWGRKRSKDTHLYPPLHCTKVWGITSINHILHLSKHRQHGAIQKKIKLD